MSEKIYSQFNKDTGPATGLTPTITILKEDGTIVVNGENMSEVGQGWYVYD